MIVSDKVCVGLLTFALVGLCWAVSSFELASQLELACYRTELKPWFDSFENPNESSRAEPITSEFEQVCKLRVFLSSPTLVSRDKHSHVPKGM